MMSVNIPFTRISMRNQLWDIYEGKGSMKLLIQDSRCAQILSCLDYAMKKSNNSIHSVLLCFHGLNDGRYAAFKEVHLVLETELLTFEVCLSPHNN